MANSNRPILITLILIVSGLISYGTIIVFKNIGAYRRLHTWSAIASLEANLLSHSYSYDPEFLQNFHNGSEEWKVLSDDEYDDLAKFLEKNEFRIDGRYLDGRPVDAWGNRFVVSFCLLSDGQLDFKTASKGPDGIYGTEDDILLSIYDNNKPVK